MTFLLSEQCAYACITAWKYRECVCIKLENHITAQQLVGEQKEIGT